NMDQFPTDGHLASWTGMCPGNNQSAGKRRSGHTTKGSRWLKRILVQAAWAASHTKGTYLAGQYRRPAKRRGCKRALVAVGPTLLVIIYQVLKRGLTSKELLLWEVVLGDGGAHRGRLARTSGRHRSPGLSLAFSGVLPLGRPVGELPHPPHGD